MPRFPPVSGSPPATSVTWSNCISPQVE